MEFHKLQKGDFSAIASIVVPNSMTVLTSGRHITPSRRSFPLIFTPVHFHHSSLSPRNAVFLLINPPSKIAPLFRRFHWHRFVWSYSRMREVDIIPGALSFGTIKRHTDRAFYPMFGTKNDFLSVLRCFSKSVYRARLSISTNLETSRPPQNHSKYSRTSRSWANEVRSPWIDILSRPTFCAIRGMRFWSFDQPLSEIQEEFRNSGLEYGIPL